MVISVSSSVCSIIFHFNMYEEFWWLKLWWALFLCLFWRTHKKHAQARERTREYSSGKAAWYSTIPHDNSFPHSCVGFVAPLESCLVGCNRWVPVPNKPRQMVSRMHIPVVHIVNLRSLSLPFCSCFYSFLCLCLILWPVCTFAPIRFFSPFSSEQKNTCPNYRIVDAYQKPILRGVWC